LDLSSLSATLPALHPAKEAALVWDSDWAWGLPVLVLTVVAHALILVFATAALTRALTAQRLAPRLGVFFLAVAFIALGAAVLHGLEAGIWAALYMRLGALADFRGAMLYSLSAITSYGHTDLALAYPWQLLGAIEAINGLILFGLTTAFLFAMIHEVQPFRRE
jgi:hypothetical protein